MITIWADNFQICCLLRFDVVILWWVLKVMCNVTSKLAYSKFCYINQSRVVFYIGKSFIFIYSDHFWNFLVTSALCPKYLKSFCKIPCSGLRGAALTKKKQDWLTDRNRWKTYPSQVVAWVIITTSFKLCFLLPRQLSFKFWLIIGNALAKNIIIYRFTEEKIDFNSFINQNRNSCLCPIYYVDTCMIFLFCKPIS